MRKSLFSSLALLPVGFVMLALLAPGFVVPEAQAKEIKVKESLVKDACGGKSAGCGRNCQDGKGGVGWCEFSCATKKGKKTCKMIMYMTVTPGGPAAPPRGGKADPTTSPPRGPGGARAPLSGTVQQPPKSAPSGTILKGGGRR